MRPMVTTVAWKVHRGQETDMTITTIIIPGPPLAQKRPRFFRRGSGVGTFNPQEAEAGQWLLTALPQIKEKIHGPVVVLAEFFFKRPRSHYGTGRNSDKLKAAAPLFHDVKPDADNLLKFSMDRLRNHAFDDDSKVVIPLPVKRWCDNNPRTEIHIYQADFVFTRLEKYITELKGTNYGQS